MGRVGTISAHTLKLIDRAYDGAHGRWTGCDWPTSFGDTGLDLNGMTAHQALLMARATAGTEAADWREAVQWLRLVEADAEAAEEAAARALTAARREDLSAARWSARAACELEARYHPRPVWTSLQEVLEALPPNSGILALPFRALTPNPDGPKL
jgi:hypothetical protein